MKILIATVELAPVASAGGVAQYTMGLARALREAGHDVHVAIPDYRFLPDFVPSILEGITVHRVGRHHHFQNVRDARGIYGTGGDFEPWVTFARAVTELVRTSRPDIVHCQDAHTSLVPVFIAAERQQNSAAFPQTRSVITIHNLLEQGKGGRDFFDRLSLPQALFDTHFEFFGQTNCFKAGLLMADRVSTVSRTYANEIPTSDEFGFGLAGVLRALPVTPAGIVNGIDAESWKLAGARYDGTDDIEAITQTKRSLLPTLLPIWSQEQEVPVIAFKARWDRQKGILLLAECMEEVLEHARFIFDTWPEPRDGHADHFDVWKVLTSLRDRYPLRFALNVPRTTSPEESVALYTAADFLIMPSVYEPCGLAQMECQRFGCIPIVRRTGGLADTVTDLTAGVSKANGIVFDTMTRAGLMTAVKRAVTAHSDSRVMKSLLANALGQDNEWNTRMEAYESLYESAKRVEPGG
ncbi:MAG: glycogen/starch synthase [Acidobacteriota bacterium]